MRSPAGAAGLFFSPEWSQSHRCAISSFWRQSLVGMTFASWAIDDDHCARIHASARSRRFGRFVRDALAELLATTAIGNVPWLISREISKTARTSVP